jgi:thioredoxin-like negative regulator of GroEL
LVYYGKINSMTASPIRSIGESGFSQVISPDGKIKVFAFYEANSGTYEMMRPVLESVSNEFRERVLFFTMDVSDQDEFMSKFHFYRTPFFLIIRGEEIVDSMVGLISLSRFRRNINNVIHKN